MAIDWRPMMGWRRVAFTAAALWALTAAAHGQRATRAPSDACRVVPTAFTTVSGGSANPAFRGTTTATCGFTAATLTFNCTIRYSDSNGLSSTMTNAAVYDSIEDVIAETAVIPPLKRLATMSVKATGRGQASGTTRFVYDAQHRLTKESSPVSTTTYSAWDSAGRPRIARGVGSNRVGWEIAFSYNDAARTQTMTNSQVGAITTCTQSFDANGNPTSSICTNTIAGAGNTTSTTRITATERICR